MVLGILILLIKDLNRRVCKLDITTLRIKIYLMNLHSLSVILAHLLDLMEVSIMYYTAESLVSLICLGRHQDPVYIHIY